MIRARPRHADDTKPNLRGACSKQRGWSTLVVQDDTEEGAVHLQSAVVLNEAQLPELIQKETDAGARGADHFRQHFLTDLRNDRLRLAFFPKVGQRTELRGR